MPDFFASLFKIAGFSLIVGMALSAFGVTAEEILARIGLTPLDAWIYFLNAIDWAIPTMLLGAVIVVPIWFVLFLLKPPGT